MKIIDLTKADKKTRLKVVCISCQKEKECRYRIEYAHLPICDRCWKNIKKHTSNGWHEMKLTELKRRERYWNKQGVQRWLKQHGIEPEELLQEQQRKYKPKYLTLRGLLSIFQKMALKFKGFIRR